MYEMQLQKVKVFEAIKNSLALSPKHKKQQHSLYRDHADKSQSLLLRF
ncbi:unnamed protein product, partial [Brassica rapa subsp. trilocularis]